MLKRVKTGAAALLLLLLAFSASLNATLPDSVSVFAEDIDFAVDEKLPAFACTSTVSGDSATVKLFGILPVKNVALNVVDTKTLYPGGMAFGLKYFTDGVLVVGLSAVEGFGTSVCPAEEAGIKKGDVILSVNGEKIDSAESFKAAIEGGSSGIALTVKRGNETFTTALYPALSAEDNKYKCGMWVRDSLAGIGTITYVSADGKHFAGLGHGVYDSETGALMPQGSGAIVDVEITGVRKGAAGAPGELKGSIGVLKRGTVESNTETGIYGTWEDSTSDFGTPLPVGLSDELKEGKAQIYSTVDGSRKQYEIEIEKIYKDGGDTRNFLIHVTDKKLLDTTGGIVQGMSGSPIIQNGKIVGAVTHVLVNDATRGYGIFIENMLNQN